MSVQSHPILAIILSLAIAEPLEGPGKLLDTAGLNSVPMMGRKRMDVPSFTSGFLPPSYPKHMRIRQNKRETDEKRSPWTGAWANIMAAKPASMYQNIPGGKRSPWSGSWANLLVKPDEVRVNSAQQSSGKRASSWTDLIAKRSAVPSDWRLGFDNLLRAPQGFRFHSGGQDYLSRDLMYKRSKEVVDVTDQKDATETDVTDQKDVTETKKKREAIPPVKGNDTEETATEANLMVMQNWLDGFESLMADASLYTPDRGPYHRTILTRVQRR